MSSQDVRSGPSESSGQDQMERPTEACRSVSQSCQEIKEQAGSCIQKGCDQAKSIAKGAVDAARSALENNSASRR